MAKRTHGRSKSKIYRAYIRLVHRCQNPRDKDFRLYGARGIYVAADWLGPDGFLNFARDLGEPPGPEYSIDRISNDGPYSKENTRWADRSTQGRNRRTARVLEFLGVRQCLTAFAEEYGLPTKVLWRRLDRGWSMGRALGTEIVRRKAA